MSQIKHTIPMVFVLAKGRSGTTLLQTILDAHPNTVAPLESRFVVHFKSKYGCVKKWTISKKNAFLKEVFTEQKISLFWEINKEMAIKKVHDLPENTSYGEVCKQIYLSVISFFEKETTKVIIDKNPIYALLIPLILEVYPNAKFIHCVRDYRACVNSTKKLQPFKKVKMVGYEWLLSNKIEAYKLKFPDKFITLRYEDLLVSSEETLQNICYFLDLPYHANMLNYYNKTEHAVEEYIKKSKTAEIKKLRTIGANSVHKNLSQPLDTSLIYNWKKMLTSKEIKELDTICSSYGSTYGYTTAISSSKQKIPLEVKLKKFKLQLYYRLPIRIRELKSKPNLVFVNPKKS
jgi:hypothetical protein